MKYSKFFKFLEKKDHLINKLSSLTPEQKQEIIAFFTKHPTFESEIDWNRRDLTYKDFEEVLNKERLSRSQIKKAVKQGITGLEKGFDYILLKEGFFKNEPYKVYQPLTWKGSRVIASNQVAPSLKSTSPDYTGAKWCISYQKSRDYWDKYVNTDNSMFMMIAGESILSKKVAIQINRVLWDTDKNLMNTWMLVWDSNDTRVEDISVLHSPDPGKFEEALIKKLYKNYNWKKLLETIPEEVFFLVDKVLSNKDLCIKNTGIEEERLLDQEIEYILKGCNYYKDHVLNITEEYAYITEDVKSMEKHFIKDGKFKFKFGEIHGNFNCNSCLSLESLENGPSVVHGNFIISGTSVNSLKNCPDYVGGNFAMVYCDIKVLDDFPKELKGKFIANSSSLESLEGIPDDYNGPGIWVPGTAIESLKGIPSGFTGDLDCSDTGIETLEYCPEHLNSLTVDYCEDLYSLKGKPKVIDEFLSICNTYCIEDYWTEYKTKIGGTLYHQDYDATLEDIEEAFEVEDLIPSF